MGVELQQVAAADEAAPAHRRVVVVVEEVLEHERGAAGRPIHVASLLLGQDRSVDDQLAVLGAGARAALEEVAQGGDAELGLDGRRRRVVDERLAVIRERLVAALAAGADADDARALGTARLAAARGPAGTTRASSTLASTRGSASRSWKPPSSNVAEASCERLDEGAAPARRADRAAVQQHADRAAHRHRAHVVGAHSSALSGELIAGPVLPRRDARGAAR